MFTGIVQGLATVEQIETRENFRRFAIRLPAAHAADLQIGASVAINGACLTITSFEDTLVHFDVMMETLRATNLGDLQAQEQVNFERAARYGDEIGGHLLSGHVHGVVSVAAIETPANNHIIWFEAPDSVMKYVVPKGYIGLNGASLTIGEVKANRFNVYLIPETLRQTTFGALSPGDTVNLEIDHQTRTIVDTVERLGLTHARS